MNELKIFENKEFGQVRTTEEDNKILFAANDVAKALGYTNPSKATNDHCKNAVMRRGNDSLGRQQEFKFITEGDLYRLIANSKLPTAEKFESWVFDEVLPTIRKTGGYVNNDEMFINTYLPNADEQTILMFKGQLNVIKNLNNRIEQDKPKVIFADAVTASKTSILIGELAKLLKQNGVNIGQNRLFEWLRDKGYLIKRQGIDRNMPTQKAMEMKLFEVKETVISHSDGHTSISKTTKITGKGQQYFINLFLKNKVS